MRKIGIGLTAALFIAAVAAPALASKPLLPPGPGLDESGHKVTICHATSSAATHQFWEVITVDVASSGGLKKLHGHVGHTALFDQEPNNRDRFDVIPSFNYAGVPFDGAPEPGEGDLDGDGTPDWEEWATLNPEDAADCLGDVIGEG